MDNPNNPNEQLLGAVTEILDSEPVKNLLSPVTKEVGELLGTFANLASFYITDNLQRICTRWSKARGGRLLEAEEVKRILPLLPVASMVSDEVLQEKWALLMESTATGTGSLPSFGQTLSQLTVEEVQYLDLLWKAVTEPHHFLSTRRRGTEPVAFATLVTYFDASIDPGVNSAEMEVFKDQLTEAQKDNYERLDHAKLVIEDLIRLGIIREERVAEPDRYFPLEDKKIPMMGSQTVLRIQYSFARYGVSFMEAVTPKPPAGPDRS